MQSLPYGIWTLADGSEVMFDRMYCPIFKRPKISLVARDRRLSLRKEPVTLTTPCEPHWVSWTDVRYFYNDGTPEEETRLRAERALGRFIMGLPV